MEYRFTNIPSSATRWKDISFVSQGRSGPVDNPPGETSMSRIPTPATIEAAPAGSQPLLQAVKQQLGIAPNLFRLVANSPAALEGYLGMSGALGKGELPAATRERVALAVAE